MNLINRIRGIKGFSLIEALVTSLIFSFALIGVGSFLIMNGKLSQRGIDEAFLQSNLNLTLQKISIDVKNGYSLSVSDTTVLEVKDQSGNTINKWEYKPELEGLNKNDLPLNSIGIDVDYDCKFTKVGDSTVKVELKMDNGNNDNDLVSTGSTYLEYYYSCRNVIDANVGF